MKFRLLKSAFCVIGILYPFALFFAGDYAVFILASLAFLWILRAKFESGNSRIMSVAAALFFLVCAIFKGGILAFLYPSLVSLAFLVFFANSLKSEAVITKFARLKDPNLDEKAVVYTRNLTKIWCLFFIFNAAFAAALACLEDKIYWSVYSGAISYLLIGALFGGEILYRKFFILKDER